MTRRLAREEGLFCGGSSGSAVVGALHYAAEMGLGRDKRIVVLLPDSGYRNLGKLYDDQWMRENRFLDETESRVQDVLSAKPHQDLQTVHRNSKVGEVVSRMKTYNVSQLPVVDEHDRLVGLVTEVNLLKYLLGSQDSDAADRPIGELEVVERSVPTVTPETSLETVMSVFATSPTVVVVASANDEHRAVSILTQIDLLSFLTRRAGR